MASAAALLTDGFRARRWSLVFGVAVGATLLARFLTGTYLFLIFGAALGWILCGEDKKRRATNLILAAGVAAALTAPIFWLNRAWVWDYYSGKQVDSSLMFDHHLPPLWSDIVAYLENMDCSQTYLLF